MCGTSHRRGWRRVYTLDLRRALELRQATGIVGEGLRAPILAVTVYGPRVVPGRSGRSVHRHAFLQLLKPIQDHSDLRCLGHPVVSRSALLEYQKALIVRRDFEAQAWILDVGAKCKCRVSAI